MSILWWGVLILSVVILGTFASAIGWKVYTMRHTILLLQDELDRTNRIIEAKHENYEIRLEMIERVIFLSVVPDVADKKRPVTSAEAWQKNWYQNHADRLTTLERWRLAHESPHK